MLQMCYVATVNPGARYYELSLLGRSAFLEAGPQATLVRRKRVRAARGTGAGLYETDDSGEVELAEGSGNWQLAAKEPPQSRHSCEFFPLSTKLGNTFVDLITLGRTSSNDIVIADASVSRSQAFFRRRNDSWFLCDAGSKNGTRVNGQSLLPRTEIELTDNSLMIFGAVEMRFFGTDALFDMLMQSPSRFQ